MVTIGAILGMAAHIEGKGCGMIDMAGLAQKGGAVFSHVRIANTPEEIHAIRVSAGKADLILGCDLVVSGAKKVLAAVREGHTIFVANTAEIMPGDFARSSDFSLPIGRLKKAIRTAAGEENAYFFDATRTATALFGNSLGANMFMLGFAFQHGGLPLSTRGNRESDRSERPGRCDECRGVPMGPPGRAISLNSSEAWPTSRANPPAPLSPERSMRLLRAA